MAVNGSFKTTHYHKAISAQLIRGGKQFFDVLESLIDKSTFEIHFQFYILENDETGNKIIKALIRAAQRGVAVYVVLDSYGSGKLSEEVVSGFEKNGVHFKWFKPVIAFNNLELGRRMHHKILVVDENYSLTTGINIANRYNDFKGNSAWLDFALISEGDNAREIKRRCLEIWEHQFTLAKGWKKNKLPKVPSSVHTKNPLIKVSVNDWLRGRNEIYNGYKKAISTAKNEIFIAGGYFLPGRMLKKALKDARKQNVSIAVILTKFSDVRFAKDASEYLYEWMFKQGIRIYEWEPSIMHGKVAVVDRTWATVGSFNLNYLSTFESIELNMEVIEKHFSSKLTDLLSEIALKECTEVTEYEYLKKYSINKRFKNWISYIFVRYTFRLLNLLSKKPN